jgi:hypothetical protein
MVAAILIWHLLENSSYMTYTTLDLHFGYK